MTSLAPESAVTWALSPLTSRLISFLTNYFFYVFIHTLSLSLPPWSICVLIKMTYDLVFPQLKRSTFAADL